MFFFPLFTISVLVSVVIVTRWVIRVPVFSPLKFVSTDVYFMCHALPLLVSPSPSIVTISM